MPALKQKEPLAAYSIVYMGENAYRVVAVTPAGFFIDHELHGHVTAQQALNDVAHSHPHAAPPSWFRMVEEGVRATEQTDPNAELAIRFPKYWKALPSNWQAIDTYRINKLFPVVGDDSGMILHARKKLLVPGVRTGGKTLTTDIAEAHATLGGWLGDNS